MNICEGHVSYENVQLATLKILLRSLF